MTYSSDPVADAGDYFDRLGRQAEAQAKADAALEAEFLKACEKGDVSAICQWAPMVNDYSRPMSKFGEKFYQKKYQTLGDILNDAADYKTSIGLDSLFQIVLNVANGKQQESEAKAAIEAMAKAWTNYNSQEVEYE